MTGPRDAPVRAPRERPFLESLERVLEPGGVRCAVQPIVRASDRLVVGYEALARIDLEPRRGPDWWLRRAEAHGRRSDLEVAFLAAAAEIGAPPLDRLLFVNLSPSLLAHPGVRRALGALPERVVVELTEQEAVDDYARLRDDLALWLGRGARVAVDDAGAGYSSLRHLIELQPDFLKLDRSLVAGVDGDPNRHALLRSIVAFAREVGTSVIAEGVERIGDFVALRDSGVHFVQGYLLARPGDPWPALHAEHGLHHVGSRECELRDARLLGEKLAGVEDLLAACSATVEHVFRWGEVMPSLYLERQGELRCIAQRGLWQVLDGMPGDAGITGRTWRRGRAIVIDDVSQDPDYLEAIPGVVAEACVPIIVHDVSVGALNIDSFVPLASDVLERLESCARVLGDWLAAAGEPVAETAWHRAMRASVSLSEVGDGDSAAERLLSCVLGATRLDSAALVLAEGPEAVVAAAIGPLATAMAALPAGELAALGSLVDHVRSCYTAGDAAGRSFTGTVSLRDAGARCVVVVPLRSQGGRVGSLVLAHSRPTGLRADEVAPLEMLADHLAARLAAGRSHPFAVKSRALRRLA